MRKLQLDNPVFLEAAEDWAKKPGCIEALQTAVYVMCGGGWLGCSAAESPATFYIDARCGRLPYSAEEIKQAVAVLIVIAEKAGLDPHKLPSRPTFHNCGIF